MTHENEMTHPKSEDTKAGTRDERETDSAEKAGTRDARTDPPGFALLVGRREDFGGRSVKLSLAERLLESGPETPRAHDIDAAVESARTGDELDAAARGIAELEIASRAAAEAIAEIDAIEARKPPGARLSFGVRELTPTEIRRRSLVHEMRLNLARIRRSR